MSQINNNCCAEISSNDADAQAVSQQSYLSESVDKARNLLIGYIAPKNNHEDSVGVDVSIMPLSDKDQRER